MTRRATKPRAAPALDRGATGLAMQVRPSRLVETAVAGITATQTLDSHLIDRLARYAQITDRQYEAGQRLLEMCGAAGLLEAGARQYGRIGHGGELTDEMAEARARWNRLMVALGSQRADLLTSVCHERHPGVRFLATVQAALDWLGDRWGFDR